jgi:urocanate hydratase
MPARRIEKRLETRYLDHQAHDLDAALAMIRDACAEGRAISVGLLGNAAEVFPELVRRGVVPDIVTDQTSAHDPGNGYLPAGWTLDEWDSRRAADPAGWRPPPSAPWSGMCRRCSTSSAWARW